MGQLQIQADTDTDNLLQFDMESDAETVFVSDSDPVFVPSSSIWTYDVDVYNREIKFGLSYTVDQIMAIAQDLNFEDAVWCYRGGRSIHNLEGISDYQAQVVRRVITFMMWRVVEPYEIRDLRN